MAIIPLIFCPSICSCLEEKMKKIMNDDGQDNDKDDGYGGNDNDGDSDGCDDDDDQDLGLLHD